MRKNGGALNCGADDHTMSAYSVVVDTSAGFVKKCIAHLATQQVETVSGTVQGEAVVPTDGRSSRHP